MSRFACVWVPHFTAAAIERCEPPLRERPLAIVAGAAPTTRIVEANGAARDEGVLAGITEAEARRRCPALATRPRSPEAEASARHALLEASQDVSPRIEDAAPGRVNVDIAGLERLIGGDAAVGQRLRQRCGSVGLFASIGIAGSRIAARMAASRGGSRVIVIAPGAERASLAATPLDVLDLPDALAATLARWGIATLGALAALPRAGIADRLGPPGLRAHDLALGRDLEPFRRYVPPPFWEEALGLEWEIDTLSALGVALGGVLERLCGRLAVAHVAADSLGLELALASGGRDDRTVPLSYPMRDVPPMLALLRLALETQPPPAPVTRIAVSAHAVPARPVPGGLWRSPSPAVRDLGAVLARLATLVGADDVGSPTFGDSHRPDAVILARFDPIGSGVGAWTPPNPDCDSNAGAGTAGKIGFRRLRPPRRIEVDTAIDPRMGASPRPTRVGLDRRARMRVLTSAGPWRISGEWWDAGAWGRDEWDVELADGTLCRLARDGITGEWCLDGVYD
jgi:protein ImuB